MKRMLNTALMLSAMVIAGCGEQASETSAAAKTDAVSSVAGDYMVVANKPNLIHLVDLAARKVERSCELPDKFGSGTIQMGPENRIAYVSTNHFENVLGVDMDSCEVVFSAVPSTTGFRSKTLGAFAVSRDGKELWIHQNRAALHRDQYESLESQVAVYNTADGLNAQPVRTFRSPRQVTLMIAGPGSTAWLGGQDIFEMDMQTGEYSVKLASLHDDNPAYGPKDVLSVWPIGSQSGEMIRMYTAPRYTDDTRNIDTAEWVWGYERVDLATGEAESRDFGPLEVVLFSGMTRPGDRDQFYAVLSQLKKFDVPTQTVVKSVDVEHSYYCINFSTDGSEIYLAGTFNDIAIHDADTLELKANIELPGGDMSLGTPQVFSRL